MNTFSAGDRVRPSPEFLEQFPKSRAREGLGWVEEISHMSVGGEALLFVKWDGFAQAQLLHPKFLTAVHPRELVA